MDNNQRFNQVESLLIQLLKSNDLHNEILLQHGEKLDLHRDLLTDIVQALHSQGEVLHSQGEVLRSQGKVIERLADGLESLEENRKMDAVHLQGSLARMENELQLIRPLLEKALDLDDRVRKIEEFLFRKGA